MHVNFREVLNAIGPNAAFRIANTATPSADYLFAQILPEELRFDYDAKRGNMTIRATGAGLVGMDSPYPPGGVIETLASVERTAKLANAVPIPEQALRELQALVAHLQLSGAPTNERVIDIILNFIQKVVVQPHLDRAEWLRGQALTAGAIDWTFGQIRLEVAYGIPVANLFAKRTDTSAWHDSASAFWTDIRNLRKILKRVRVFIAHPDTIDVIRYNTANAIVAISEDAGGVTIRRTVNSGANFSADVGDTVRLVAYDREFDVLDPATPNTTKKVPFMPREKILAVADNVVDGFGVNVGRGGTEDPDRNNRVGYTHVAPTTEGGGTPGRWSQLYVPEDKPWSIAGRGVSNVLPVIEAPAKVAVAYSELANP